MKSFKFQSKSCIALAALASMLAATSAIAQLGVLLPDANGIYHWGTNGVDLTYVTPNSGFIYYGINGNGINDGAFSSLGLNGVICEQTNEANPVDIGWATLDDNGGSWLSTMRLEARSGYMYTGGSKELQVGSTATYIGAFGYQPNMFMGDTYSACTTGLSIGQGMGPSAPPANGLLVVGPLSMDNGSITSDGSGNMTVVHLTQTSDRNMKENIQPIAQGKSLQMALALPDFSWNFKAQPNSAQQAAKDTQFGPMAQDWHAVTGLDDGRHISVTAMQGMLLGAVQDLAGQLPSPGTVSKSTDSTSGYGAGLVKWDENYIYISVGKNQWKRAALASW